MKTAIFVDVQNIYYTTRDTFKRSFNYKNFWNHIESNNKIIIANAYAVDKGDEKQQKFQYALKSIGFNVKLKPYISRADGSAKGDWDVGITIDILDSAEEVEKIDHNELNKQISEAQKNNDQHKLIELKTKKDSIENQFYF